MKDNKLIKRVIAWLDLFRIKHIQLIKSKIRLNQLRFSKPLNAFLKHS